jgi:outer membrane receptor protein involved in Fe transport
MGYPVNIRLLPLLLLAVSFAGAQAPNPPAKPPQAQDQVTVTANRSSVPIGETAKTAYTLDPTQLHDYPSVTLDESLRQHAGFELFRRAPSRVANPTSEGISLRGLGSTAVSRTLVLEDGAPLNDPFGGWIHWSESPQQTIQSVTLVTGGGSDLYGSSALGGVIDVIPATAAPTRFDAAGVGGSQSTNDLTATATHTGHALDILAAGESLRTAGYIPTDPGVAGTVDIPANVISQSWHTELGRRDFKPSTRPDRIFLTGNLLNESRGNGTPLTTNATRLWRYLAGYDPPETKDFSSRIRLFGSDQGYRQSFSSVAANRDSETLTRLQRVHTDELGATGDATLHVGHIAAVAGADIRDIRAEDNETPISKGVPNGFADVTARQRFIGGFGELLGEYKSWSGAASLRADRASNLDIVQSTATSQTTPPNRTEIVLSPRAGLVRALGPHAEVHASGFRAFREPSMNELYRTGQVGSQTTLPNASLLSERATGWEIGSEISPTHRLPATLHATYFWTEINRPVSAVLVSQTATASTYMRENLGQIRSQGVELSAAFHPAHALFATLGYQYAVATVTQFSAQPTLVGNWIPEVPRQSFTAQLHATSERLGELTVAARASGMDFDDANNQFALNGFFALDVSGHRALTRYLDASFLVQNLTDRRPQVSRTPTLTLGSPIFAEAGLRLHFGGAQVVSP